jgi:glucose/arabinose dehydrogenase/PKD repeat protein
VSFPKLTALAAVAAAIAFPATAGAATYPAGFEEQTIVGGLTRPTTVAWAPDGRMFVAEKDGVLKVVAPGASTAAVVLDLSAQVSYYGDRGFVGLAVDSQFAEHPYLYLAYTRDINPFAPDNNSPAVAQLMRLRINPANQVSEQTVILGTYVDGPCPAAANTLDCIPSDGASHSIGTVRSAPDGTLWVGSGDATDDGGSDLRALRTYDETSMAGKIMHIDRNGLGLPSHPFCPGDTNLTHVCTKLYAKGFRNPFRFAFRPGGGLTVGDVGWRSREEIDLIDEGGHNYGWPCYEGSIHTPGYQDLAQCQAQYANPPIAPTYEYEHGGSLSVLGGLTYSGDAYPAEYSGSIFFGDYSGGFLRRLVANGTGGYGAQAFADGWTGTAIEEGPDLNLTYVSAGNFGTGTGSVRRIVYSPGSGTPIARIGANPTSGPAPLAVSFTGSGSSDPDGDPLSYSWDFGDGGTSSDANPSHTYAAGNYTARLTVSDGRGKSASATQQISAGNSAPQITIGGASTYRGGEVFSVTGSASDAEDGTLPPSALEWNVRLIHIEHTHPAGTYSGVSQINVQASSDHDADSHYEVELSATDSGGLTARKTVAINPETTTVHLRSEPSGAPVSYGGRQLATPQDLTTAIGFQTTISVPASFQQNGQTFDFVGWSDGGARVHEYTVPPGGGTLTATFEGSGQASPVGSPGGEQSGGGQTGGGQSGGVDSTGPTLRLTGVSPRRGRLRGLALDASGVRAVRVALRERRSDGGCRWWIPRLERMSAGRRSCKRPRLHAAELTATDGGARWLAKLGGSLPAGRYRVVVRALDNAGNKSRLRAGPSTLIRVKG